MTTDGMPPTLAGADRPGSGTDTIVRFASLRPLVSEPSADELAEMRHAAFAVVPLRIIGDTNDDIVTSVGVGVQSVVAPAVDTGGRHRLRVALLLATAATIIATLALVRRPDGGATPGGSDTTASAASTTARAAPASDARSTPLTTVGIVVMTTTVASPVTESPPVGSVSAPLVLPNERLDPLASFFAGTENSARLRQRSLAGQPYIAECMRSRGWQYTEQTIADVYSPTEVLRTRDPDEFRRRYGYGYTTVENGTSYVFIGDPNQTFLDTLTDEQLTAWYLDLQGNNNPDALSSPTPSCQQVGYDKVAAAGDGGPVIDLGLASVDPRYDSNQDSRVMAATAAWRVCAGTAGYTFRFPFDAERLLAHKQTALLRSAREAWDPRSNELPTIPQTQLGALQDEERRIAAMDHRCDLEVGLAASRTAANAEIAAALRERFPEVVVEPYDPNLR